MDIKHLKDIKIEAGSPLPMVLSTETHLCLLFYSNWGDTDETQDMEEAATISIVRFEQYLIYKFGVPTDETLLRHPLYNAGLTHYAGHIVEKSLWIEEIVKVDSVHPYHNKETFKEYRHYVLTFHDSTFECIAKKYEVEYTQQSFDEIAHTVLQRVIPV